ncbi:28S ribosomal protein S18b, mitochondrial isoform X1 [Hyla sarda]|uniref:28S ribosomal protein S18b, mitochondrial isoform X1 n=1 Tax=Hyla sarda TaxID=327740 RepID=UPI0024C25A00|nr:28S ribosomal protein S18b, mitochondrial isoform X1 [Hyla sarda]
MAASLGRLCVTGVRGLLWSRTPLSSLPLGVRSLCSPPEEFVEVSRYKEQPWEYLNSEEYLERYGQRPVWADYRRNHKGSIPPQKTRKTCIRGNKVCGNPCPICRDQNLGVDYRNVKLLQQFLCPHTGAMHHPTRTGVCMKQYKRLVKAISEAEDHGHLPVLIPHKDITFGDCSRNYGAVAQTPPAPPGPWYSWYEWQEPSATEVAKLEKLYKPYWKQMMGEQ